jgi:hypothetical protein
MPHPQKTPTGRTIRIALLVAGLALNVLVGINTALAKPATTNKSASEPAKRKGVSKITYQRSSSEETTAERDRRMYRECKGMHNAGACRGYTRK